MPPLRLVEGDRIVAQTVDLFRANSRTPDARSGDLRAQVAGNYTGERRLLELYERYGFEGVESAIARALDDSELRMRAALRAIGDGVFDATDYLEDLAGAPSIAIALRLELRDGERRAGLFGDLAAGRLSAQRRLRRDALRRALCAARRHRSDHPDERRMLSSGHGARAATDRCSIRAARRRSRAATSKRACATPRSCCRRWHKPRRERVPACSGGTMSNVMLGGTRPDGETWAFYETNGCGMGARPHADGIDGIHCHMTNTLNTPIEAIEREFPLRVVRYELADGTGGAGRQRGGNGLIRALQLVEGSARATLLADRHTRRPPGAWGGEPGACGRHALTRDRAETPLRAKTSLALEPGDVLTIQTPGGGGYGAAEPTRHTPTS